MNRVIGKCSNCGGNVVLPTLWGGVNPPTATCTRCGGEEQSSIPVINISPVKAVRDFIKTRMFLCPDCGNKRCPKASDHGKECTGSNEIGQTGSAYEGEIDE